MKNGMKKVLVLVLMIISLFAISCTTMAGQIKLNKKNVTIKAGDSYRLRVKNAKKKVKWKSSNTKIATVNQNGVVTGERQGIAKISAKVGRKKLTCKVKVKAGAVRKGTVTNNGINYTAVLKNGKELQLTINNNSSNAIILGWTDDFIVYYHTTKGTYSAGFDVMKSLWNSNDLNFNKINPYATRTYTANISSLKGTLKSITLTNIYPLNSNGLPQFDMRSFKNVCYTISITL